MYGGGGVDKLLDFLNFMETLNAPFDLVKSRKLLLCQCFLRRGVKRNEVCNLILSCNDEKTQLMVPRVGLIC